MTHTPTTHDLTTLADSIARDGVAAHTDQLNQLANTAEPTGLFPASIAVLRDANAKPMLKARAFQALHRNWDSIEAAATAKTTFDAAFEALAQQWRDHEALRSTGDIASLWASRAQLDARRAEARMACKL